MMINWMTDEGNYIVGMSGAMNTFSACQNSLEVLPTPEFSAVRHAQRQINQRVWWFLIKVFFMRECLICTLDGKKNGLMETPKTAAFLQYVHDKQAKEIT